MHRQISAWRACGSVPRRRGKLHIFTIHFAGADKFRNIVIYDLWLCRYACTHFTLTFERCPKAAIGGTQYTKLRDFLCLHISCSSNYPVPINLRNVLTKSCRSTARRTPTHPHTNRHEEACTLALWRLFNLQTQAAHARSPR